MRRAWVILAAAGLFGLGCASGQAFSPDTGGAEEKAGEAPAAAGEPTAAEMEAWMKYMTPGPEHQQMASMTGEWNAAVKMWMAPGAPVNESTGTAKFRMILGGRDENLLARRDAHRCFTLGSSRPYMRSTTRLSRMISTP